MISADRFIVQARHHDAWVAARSRGVTATEIRDAATPSGFAEVTARTGPLDPNIYMEFGSWAEPQIMAHAHREHGILPSDWLIASAENRSHMATVDGLSVDHTEIAEAKTTGEDWGALVPIKYRRQIQFQLYVTGAERCLLLWNLRVPDGHGWFYLGWFEPKTLWVERDPDMISDLLDVADRLMDWKRNAGEVAARVAA